MFCHFWQKFEKSKWPPFLAKIDEIALSRTVKEIEANLCFAIFGKNSKNQNGRHFWGGENFFKIAKSTFLKIRKFKMAAIFGEGKIFLNCKEYIP